MYLFIRISDLGSGLYGLCWALWAVTVLLSFLTVPRLQFYFIFRFMIPPIGRYIFLVQIKKRRNDNRIQYNAAMVVRGGEDDQQHFHAARLSHNHRLRAL
jgi:hypothetical protein